MLIAGAGNGILGGPTVLRFVCFGLLGGEFIFDAMKRPGMI